MPNLPTTVHIYQLNHIVMWLPIMMYYVYSAAHVVCVCVCEKKSLTACHGTKKRWRDGVKSDLADGH